MKNAEVLFITLLSIHRYLWSKMKTYRHIFLIYIILHANIGHSESTNKHHALIIANKGYKNTIGKLENPHKDGKLLADGLSLYQFDVRYITEASRETILSEVHTFASKLRLAGPNAVGLFYYSGHGVSDSQTKRNYIIPIDVESMQNSQLWYRSVELTQVQQILSDLAPNASIILLFDACRNELRLPVKGARGFVTAKQHNDVLIGFSTGPGSSASDGQPNDRVGPYALALAETLQNVSEINVISLLSKVKFSVLKRTNGLQQPWFIDGLRKSVVFRRDRVQKPQVKKVSNNDFSGVWRIRLGEEDGTLEVVQKSRKDRHFSGKIDMFNGDTYRIPKGRGWWDGYVFNFVAFGKNGKKIDIRGYYCMINLDTGYWVVVNGDALTSVQGQKQLMHFEPQPYAEKCPIKGTPPKHRVGSVSFHATAQLK